MTIKNAVQMKDRTFNGKEPVLIIAFLQDFMETCDAYNIYEEVAMWLLTYYPRGPVESVIKARFTLPTETTKAQEGYLLSYLTIINYLLKRYPTDDNVATVDANIRIFKH